MIWIIMRGYDVIYATSEEEHIKAYLRCNKRITSVIRCEDGGANTAVLLGRHEALSQ